MSATWKRVQVSTLSTDSHKALSVIEGPSSAPGPKEVTLKLHYAGINATDINSFMGGYGGGGKPDFDAGLEALGTVTALGAEVTAYTVGQAVVIQGLGSWAEYKNFSVSSILTAVPAVDPKYLTLPISVMTAALSVGEQSEAKAGEVALVTAAAGGFGQFAVQFLKAKGCTVVGTCSSLEKAEFLKTIGCDRVVNYKTENLGEVLKAEYPRGVDIVYESIGGEIFEQCLRNLALFGRLIVIGAVTGYKQQANSHAAAAGSGGIGSANPSIPIQLLQKSATMKGFFLPHWAHLAPKYVAELVPKIENGTVKAQIDSVKTFEGLDQIADAVEHLHSGKSFGKVVVKIQ